MMKLYTIGHSNHPLNKLVGLLDERSIVNLVDVRTDPYSRYNQQFNKETLGYELPRHNIRYLFMGKVLGGRPDDPKLYKRHTPRSGEVDFLHEVDYQQIMRRPWFQQGIQELLDLAELDNTAIMCSEEDPAECHRHHLIAKYIIEQFPEVDVRHIRGDGKEFGAKSILKSVNDPPVVQDSLF
jgi:uncharacterized protein (DUF488 family)